MTKKELDAMLLIDKLCKQFDNIVIVKHSKHFLEKGDKKATNYITVKTPHKNPSESTIYFKEENSFEGIFSSEFYTTLLYVVDMMQWYFSPKNMIKEKNHDKQKLILHFTQKLKKDIEGIARCLLEDKG